MQIYAKNPLAIATFFDIFMQAFLDGLLGLPYGNNDFSLTHRGIFGWTQAYMFILKVSGKAMGPHAHGLLKIHGLDHDKLIERIHDPMFKVMYKQYLPRLVKQNIRRSRTHWP